MVPAAQWLRHSVGSGWSLKAVRALTPSQGKNCLCPQSGQNRICSVRGNPDLMINSSMMALGPFPGQHASLPICKCDFCKFVAEVWTHSRPNFAHFCLFLFLKTAPWCVVFMTTPDLWITHQVWNTRKFCLDERSRTSCENPHSRAANEKLNDTVLFLVSFFIVSHKVFVSIHPCPAGSLLALLDQSVFERQEYTLPVQCAFLPTLNSTIRALKMLNETRKLAKTLGDHPSLNPVQN